MGTNVDFHIRTVSGIDVHSYAYMKCLNLESE